jgi:hypothetical protein
LRVTFRSRAFIDSIRLAWWRRLCPSSFVLAGITVLVVWIAITVLLRQGQLETVLSTSRAELAAPPLVALIATGICEQIWPAERRPVLARGHMQWACFVALHAIAVILLMTLLSAPADAAHPGDVDQLDGDEEDHRRQGGVRQVGERPGDQQQDDQNDGGGGFGARMTTYIDVAGPSSQRLVCGLIDLVISVFRVTVRVRSALAACPAPDQIFSANSASSGSGPVGDFLERPSPPPLSPCPFRPLR